MIRPFTFLILVACTVVFVRALIAASRGFGTPRGGLVALEGLLVVQALRDGASLVAGHRPSELATHLGYLLVSVGLLPLLVPRLVTEDRWSSGSVAVASAGAFVVCVRLWATWRA